ncbi:cytochrome c peroxidase [Pendulispora albinea]|uniref:Cytochrome c domain-containing protein n=1 Tax=Pendulispora albinea TaxID=2741071 RepID=A0ABZ2M955_9BACT
MKTTTLIGGIFGALILGWSGMGCSGAESRDDSGSGNGGDSEEMSEAALTDAVGTSAYCSGRGSSVLRGAKLFFFEFPGVKGNGRTCATCHRPEDGFALSPATAERLYRSSKGRDPLFKSIDADDGKNDYTSLRTKGLVRVTLKLPPNVKLADDPAATTVTVLRAVPTVLNAALTAPYQQDGRQPNLESQALGALHDHALIQREPASRALEDVSNFQKVLFSSLGTFVLANAIERGQNPLPNVDPPLSAYEKQGKALFEAKCSSLCHSGPTQTGSNIGFGQAQNIFVSGPRPPKVPFGFEPSTLPVRPYIFTNPDGSMAVCPLTRKAEPCPSTDPGIALITGKIDDFNSFDIPQLRGIRYTAPYFHDNSAATMEDMMKHYTAAYEFLIGVGVPGIPHLPVEDYGPMIAYMNKL